MSEFILVRLLHDRHNGGKTRGETELPAPKKESQTQKSEDCPRKVECRGSRVGGAGPGRVAPIPLASPFPAGLELRELRQLSPVYIS